MPSSSQIIVRISVGAILLLPLGGPLAAGGIEIQGEELPPAIQGLEYSVGFHTLVDGRCPFGNVGFFLESGSLPRGVHTTDEGLGGTPKEKGMFRFRIAARNICASSVREFELLVTARPILRAFPEEIAITVPAADAPATDTMLISSTWPGLPYEVSTPDGAWLKLQPVRGITPEQGSALSGDRVLVQVNPKDLSPGVHHGTIIVSAWRASGVTIDVTVTLPAAK
jgi:hypothetical protein